MDLHLLINLLLGRWVPWELDLSLWGWQGCVVAWLSLCRALGSVCHSSYLALAASSLPPSRRARRRSRRDFRAPWSCLDPAGLAAVSQGRPTAGSSSPHRPGLGRQAGRCSSNRCRQSGDSPAVFQHRESTLSCTGVLEKASSRHLACK